MTGHKLTLARVTILISETVLFSLAILIFCGHRVDLPVPPFAGWLTGALTGLFVNSMICKKEGTVNSTVFFTALWGCASGIYLVWSMSSGGLFFWMVIITFLLGAAPVIHSALLIHEKWNYNRQILFLDVMMVAAAFLMLCEYRNVIESGRVYLIWTLAALAMNLLVLIVYRMQDSGLLAGGSVLLAALLGVAAWVGGSCLQGAAKGIVAFLRKIADLLLFLLSRAAALLMAFMNWLMNLLPSTDEAIPAQNMPVGTGMMPEASAEIAAPDPAVLYAIAVILALFAGFLIWRRLRGLRWHVLPGMMLTDKKKDLAGDKGRRKRRESLLSLLGQKLLFCFRYLLHRNSPEGLLTFTETHLARTGIARKSDESAPMYLRRVAEYLDQQGEASGQVLHLADDLEKLYYGFNRHSEESTAPGFAGKYRQAIRRVGEKMKT